MGQSMALPGGRENQPKFAPGSAEEVLFNFCIAVADNDTATASDYVSLKAGGILAKLRDGDLAEEKIEEIVDAIAPVNELTPNADQPGGGKRTLRNGKNQTISFTVKKEKETYKITELSVSKLKRAF